MARRYSNLIHYINTAGVAQLTGRRTVGEESVAEYRPKHDTLRDMIGAGYAASEWASEALLERSARKWGLAITVHRPTNMASDSRTGEDADPVADVADSLLRYLSKVGAGPLSVLWDTNDYLDFMSVGAVTESVSAAAVDEGKGNVGSESGLAKSRPPRFVNHSGETRIQLKEAKRYVERQTGRTMRDVLLSVWVTEAEMVDLDPLIAEVGFRRGRASRCEDSLFHR